MKNHELKNLTDYSPEDKPWDERRSFSDDVGGIYLRAAGFEHYGERVGACSGILRLGGQQTQRPEKRVCGCVMRGSVVSGTVRSASGGAP